MEHPDADGQPRGAVVVGGGDGMSDLVVTVPMKLWQDWIAEGDLPGEEAEYESHFWLWANPPVIHPGERVYIVAHGRLRGYAPLVRVEQMCRLNPRMGCLVREGGAVAVTIPEPIRGFRGVQKRWWDRADEMPFPDWQTEGVPEPLTEIREHAENLRRQP